jgi:FAD/FMN-containing dehydrogenase
MSVYQTDLAVEALRPGDDGYDEAARVFFTTGEPALVVRPRDPDEVAAVLAHAVQHDLAVSVRSGGHSPLGHSTNTGGMVMDLSHLDDVQILDAGRQLVRVGGGATWGRVAAALDPYGWGLTAGDTGRVGVGGLTLGGGVGWMVRRYGLAIDNLVGARVAAATSASWSTSTSSPSRCRTCISGGWRTGSTTRPICFAGGGMRCGSRRRSCPAPWC